MLNQNYKMGYLEDRRQWKQFGKPKVEKPFYRMPKFSEKKLAELAEAKKVVSGESLDDWFEKGMKEYPPICMECGMNAHWLFELTEDIKKAEAYKLMWRASQAHILPKKKKYGFPSIATNPDNRIILFPSWGGHLCGCHGFYDSNWYNASTMKIWPKVIEIVTVKLYPVLTIEEKKRIPEIFLPFLNKEHG